MNLSDRWNVLQKLVAGVTKSEISLKVTVHTFPQHKFCRISFRPFGQLNNGITKGIGL